MKCFIKNCRSSQHFDWNLSFHRFPKVEERARIWAKLCGLEELFYEKGVVFFNSKRICSLHFENQMYDERERLLEEAIPTVFNVQNDFQAFPATTSKSNIHELIPNNLSPQPSTSGATDIAILSPILSTSIIGEEFLPISSPKSHSLEKETMNVSTQTSTTLSSSTPRKRKLKLKVGALNKENHRIKKRIKTSSSSSSLKLEKISKEEFLNIAKRFLPEQCISFLEYLIGLKSVNVI